MDVWRHTHDYVTKTKGVGNLLWAYAPNSPVQEQIGDASPWYPGDDYVDVICVDSYQWDFSPTGADRFTNDLIYNCQQVVRFAKAHGKIPAICETGVQKGVTTKTETNSPQWFTKDFLEPILNDAECSQIAYVLTWSEGPLFEPPHMSYMKGPEYFIPSRDETPQLFQDFLDFYASPHTVFAGELGRCSPDGPSPIPVPTPAPTPAPMPAPAPTPPCDDVPPPVGHTCAEHKSWGHCDEQWMANYCCKTCFGCAAGCGAVSASRALVI